MLKPTVRSCEEIEARRRRMERQGYRVTYTDLARALPGTRGAGPDSRRLVISRALRGKYPAAPLLTEIDVYLDELEADGPPRTQEENHV